MEKRKLRSFWFSLNHCVLTSRKWEQKVCPQCSCLWFYGYTITVKAGEKEREVLWQFLIVVVSPHNVECILVKWVTSRRSWQPNHALPSDDGLLSHPEPSGPPYVAFGTATGGHYTRDCTTGWDRKQMWFHFRLLRIELALHVCPTTAATFADEYFSPSFSSQVFSPVEDHRNSVYFSTLSSIQVLEFERQAGGLSLFP